MLSLVAFLLLIDPNALASDAPIRRIPPTTPMAALEHDSVAACRVRFVRESDGTTSIVDTECVATGNRRQFRRASEEAVEQWRYSPAESSREETACFLFDLSHVATPPEIANFCSDAS